MILTMAYPMSFDENYFVSSFGTLVSSERRRVFDLILATLFLNILDFSSFFSTNCVRFFS